MPTVSPQILLDVHVHLVPFAPGEGRTEGIQWTGDVLGVDGAQVTKRELYRPDELLRWMDENGVAQSWISIPPALYRFGLDGASSRRWTDIVNEGLVSVCHRAPTRLAPMLHLPVQHPEVANEVAAAAVAAGRPCFAMPTGEAERKVVLSDAAYQPLWAALDEAGAFLFLHPSRGCDGRLDPFNLQNLLGTPTETAIAAAHLLLAGIPERFPNIRFCLAHGGGTAPAVLGRMEHGQATQQAGGAYLGTERARHSFRRFCVDCMTHDAAALDLAASSVGSNHVLFGSDWPFEMGLSKPHDQLASIAEDLRRKITVDNPASLLRSMKLAGGSLDPA